MRFEKDMKKSIEKKILHITPHLGGGVGKVLLNYISFVNKKNNQTHKITCLDYANDAAKELAIEKNILIIDNISILNKKRELFDMIKDSDIVMIHWWNHPLLYDLLVRDQLPACRVIMWCHNSGLWPPNIFTDKILDYPDLFVFTTPISYKTEKIKNVSSEIKKKIRVVWSTGGVNHIKSIKPKKHSGFNIGYLGTVDYSKMHRDFLKICDQVDIPDVKFIVCGVPSGKEIEQEAKDLGIEGKFEFTGRVDDIGDYLSIFDVFGYLLAPYHYGTCDQVIQESMAASVVPVVFSNPMESYMVNDRLTGIVANNKTEYVDALKELYLNKKLRNSLSKNAKKHAMKEFTVEKMTHDWDKLFVEVLDYPKKIRKWKFNGSFSDLEPKDVFIESLGIYGEPFLAYCAAKNKEEKEKAVEKIKDLAKSINWQVKTKGTVHQYYTFFPNDQYLSAWSQLMRGHENVKNYEEMKN